MATCKECVHVEVCSYAQNSNNEFEHCANFRDRSRFLELPVKISDKYYMDIKQAKTVSNMLLTISQNFEYNGDNSSAFKSYFIGVGDAIESCLKVLTPFWKEKK